VNISPLGNALLGLVMAAPQTGYALRKVFETTPLGTFSSSPGSIYPALGKLAKSGLLELRSPKTGGKKLYHITDNGQAALDVWLRTSVTLDEIADNVDHVLLRFAFLQSIPTNAATRNFLLSFESAVRAHLKNLCVYMDTAHGRALSRHGRLAMDNGIRGYEAHLAWSIHAQKEFTS
jgi:DNA-binding PadR family transcriptional regulator